MSVGLEKAELNVPTLGSLVAPVGNGRNCFIRLIITGSLAVFRAACVGTRATEVNPAPRTLLPWYPPKINARFLMIGPPAVTE